MLRNELYRGVRVWNRTVKVRNPETGRKTSKARPKEEWEQVGVPKLRIVTEDLWNAVHARIKQMNANLGAARLRHEPYYGEQVVSVQRIAGMRRVYVQAGNHQRPRQAGGTSSMGVPAICGFRRCEWTVPTRCE